MPIPTRISARSGGRGDNMTLEKDRLSSAQMVILGLFAFIGDMALVYPAVMASSAHQDAWITGLISVPLGIGTIFLLVTLGNIDPTKTIIELSRQILGKWLGGAVGLYYLFFICWPVLPISVKLRISSAHRSTRGPPAA